MTSTAEDIIVDNSIEPEDKKAFPGAQSPKHQFDSPASENETVPNLTATPYSSFTKRTKWQIVFLSTFAATFSPLSSFIFFPAITALSESLDVSIGKINLTITSYMIVAGIAPTLLGNSADVVGRGIVYLLMMTIYCVADVGLALQSSWIALSVLRMVQSAGSAATIAVGYGVVSDIATPAERGNFVSGLVIGPNIATAIGPILGGALAQSPGWRWIFWTLSILSGICLLLHAMFFPETARSVVGDGSMATSPIHRPLCSYFHSKKLSSSCPETPDGGQLASQRNISSAKTLQFFEMFRSLKLLWAKDCLCIILIFSIFYMNLSCVQASTSSLFIKIYGISQLQAGLVYLPAGWGSIIGAYGAGHLLKYDYSLTARKHGITINIEGGDDIAVFPIEEARRRSIWYSICAGGICTIGYGWALHFEVHMVVPLIIQFGIGLSTAIVLNTSATLLVDIHPKSPSGASAANSIVRCLLAAGGLALVQIFIEAVYVGWTFTLFGGLCIGCLGLSWLEGKFGSHWRQQMSQRGVER